MINNTWIETVLRFARHRASRMLESAAASLDHPRL